MKGRSVHYVMVIVLTLFLTSCLTCEKKEYTFQFTGANSGRLTIRYINIFANSLDSIGELRTDYDELMDMWFNGEKIERDFPKASKFKKRLYEQNGELCGEVTMEFKDLSDVRLFRYHDQGPFMFSMSSVTDDGENFMLCNGEYGGEHMPVIFWPTDSKTLRFTTSIARPDSASVSMLETYRKYSEKR